MSIRWLARWGLLVILLRAIPPGRAAVPVSALAFSPDGTVLASAGARAVELRSPVDGSVVRSVPCALARISSLAFHPARPWLAVGGGVPGVRGEMAILDWKTGRTLHHRTNHTDLVTGVAIDPNGLWLGLASADQTASLWRFPGNDRAAPEQTWLLNGHSGPVLALAFGPEAQSVVTGSADRSIKVWSSETGRLIRSFSQHTEPVHALIFRPSHRGQHDAPVACASGGDDRTVRIWQPEIGRMVRIVRGHAGAVFALAYAADGKSLFSGGAEGILRRLDADSDTILAEWSAHADWIYALAISPDGTRLASGDWTGAVKLWNLNALPGRSIVPANEQPVRP